MVNGFDFCNNDSDIIKHQPAEDVPLRRGTGDCRGGPRPTLILQNKTFKCGSFTVVGLTLRLHFL